MRFVLYEKKGKIAYITLNRPEKLNALNPDVLKELVDVWVDFRDDDNLWVAIIGGNGKSFCAGADVVKLGESGFSPLGKQRSTFITTSPALLSTPTRYEIWKPVIAALHGYVIGAGLWMALGCDIRIAAEDTSFVLPEPKFGLPTTVAAVVHYYVPRGIANEMLLVGDKVDVQRAYQLGLVNKVVPNDQLMDTATALANRLCENAPLALRAMKEVMERGKDMDYAGALALTEHVFAAVKNSEDLEEGYRAIKEKRKPEWKGR
jgi:enoyl-CoA hydratase/carnithine racemase